MDKKIIIYAVFLLTTVSCMKRQALNNAVISYQYKQLTLSIKGNEKYNNIDTEKIQKKLKKITHKALRNNIRDSFSFITFYNLYDTPSDNRKNAAKRFYAFFISQGDTLLYYTNKNKINKERLNPRSENYKYEKANVEALLKKKPLSSCYDCTYYQYFVQYITIKKDSININGYNLITTF